MRKAFVLGAILGSIIGSVAHAENTNAQAGGYHHVSVGGGTQITHMGGVRYATPDHQLAAVLTRRHGATPADYARISHQVSREMTPNRIMAPSEQARLSLQIQQEAARRAGVVYRQF